MELNNVVTALRIMGVNVSVTMLWGLFAYAHYVQFQQVHEFHLLLWVVAESWIALMFLIRKDETSKSTRPIEWAVAAGGTFVSLLLRPSAQGIAPDIGSVAIIIGVCIQIAGLMSLNRSFGIVPANRGVKTGGTYRFVRHPLYGSYLITFTGYVFAHSSIYNLSIYIAWLVLMLFRIVFEERHLLRDESYQRYTGSVRWRLVPYIF